MTRKGDGSVESQGSPAPTVAAADVSVTRATAEEGAAVAPSPSVLTSDNIAATRDAGALR